jgi:hypothetical protein
MFLVNPSVLPQCRVEVIEFAEPTPDGAGGHLLAQCDTYDAYLTVRERLDEPPEYGILKSRGGGV